MKIEKAKKTKIISTKVITHCALFVAILIVMAQLVIPFSPVPLTLGLLGILLCGSLLGKKLGVICVIIYILMGLCGLPVFAEFKSSAALVGPTGGFIVGYLPTAFTAAIAGSFAYKNKIIMFGLLILAVLFCYLFGIGWFMYYQSVSIYAALPMFSPYLLVDAIKIIAAGLITIRLKKYYQSAKRT